MEDHKSEIENWELGAGIYISFYLMRNSLQDDTNAMTELVREFIERIIPHIIIYVKNGCYLILS